MRVFDFGHGGRGETGSRRVMSDYERELGITPIRNPKSLRTVPIFAFARFRKSTVASHLYL